MPTSTGTYQDPFAVGSNAYNVAGNTAQSNLGAAGYNVQLSNLINSQNRDQQTLNNNNRLGPQGVQTQQNLLDVSQRQSQGLLDPATEQMLQSGIAANGMASGMGVDSPNMASAYRRALGQDINATEAQGQSNYLGLLAANPSAPLYDMSGQLVSPSTYASTADAQATQQEQQRQFDLALAEKARQANLSAQSQNAARSGGRVPTAAEANTVPGGGGGAGGVATTPAGYASGGAQDYNSGGSSVFGTTGNGYDMFDPTGLFSGYGSMPNYSSPGADPIASATGMGGSGVPANTGYNQANNTYTNNFGLPDYYSGAGPSYYNPPAPDPALDNFASDWGF